MIEERGYVTTILGNFPLNEKYKEIIRHDAFNRLRYISQTGLADRVFSGLTGNRYEHSIAACGIMEMYADVLFCKGCISEDEKEILPVAALLHDIGHAPFSHLSEELIRFYQSDFDHKKFGMEIINEYRDSNGKTIAEILERQGYCVKEIEKIILKNSSLSIILSHKPFGADKVAYTLHDSKRIGEPMLEYESFFQLIPSIYFKNNKFGVETHGEVEYFTSKIKKLCECYQTLYLRCYFSDEVRVIERMMQKVLEREIKNGNIEIQRLKLHNEFDTFHILHNSKDKGTKNLLRRIDTCKIGNKIFSLYCDDKRILEFYKNPRNLSQKEMEVAEILRTQPHNVVITQIREPKKTFPQDIYFFEGGNEISSFYKEHPEEKRYFENKAKEILSLEVYVDGDFHSFHSKIEEIVLSI